MEVVVDSIVVFVNEIVVVVVVVIVVLPSNCAQKIWLTQFYVPLVLNRELCNQQLGVAALLSSFSPVKTIQRKKETNVKPNDSRKVLVL